MATFFGAVLGIAHSQGHGLHLLNAAGCMRCLDFEREVYLQFM